MSDLRQIEGELARWRDRLATVRKRVAFEKDVMFMRRNGRWLWNKYRGSLTKPIYDALERVTSLTIKLAAPATDVLVSVRVEGIVLPDGRVVPPVKPRTLDIVQVNNID